VRADAWRPRHYLSPRADALAKPSALEALRIAFLTDSYWDGDRPLRCCHCHRAWAECRPSAGSYHAEVRGWQAGLAPRVAGDS